MAEGGPYWIAAGDDAFVLAAGDGSEIMGVTYWVALEEESEAVGESVGSWMFIHGNDPENHVSLGVEDRDDQGAALEAAQAEHVRHRINRGDRSL